MSRQLSTNQRFWRTRPSPALLGLMQRPPAASWTVVHRSRARADGTLQPVENAASDACQAAGCPPMLPLIRHAIHDLQSPPQVSPFPQQPTVCLSFRSDAMNSLLIGSTSTDPFQTCSASDTSRHGTGFPKSPFFSRQTTSWRTCPAHACIRPSEPWMADPAANEELHGHWTV